MSSSAFALFFAITIGQTLAQSTATYLSEFPECARQPLIREIADSGCVLSDTDCICSSQSLLQTIATAIIVDCDATDQSTSLKIAGQICPNASAVMLGSVPSSQLDTSSTLRQGGSTMATISAPGLTTTLLMGPQPTSMPLTISIPVSTTSRGGSDTLESLQASSLPSVPASSKNSAVSANILYDTSSILFPSTTSGLPSIEANSTSTYSTTRSSPTAAGSASGMKRLGWVTFGILGVGAIFAEF